LDIHVVCSSSKFYLILCVIIDDVYNTTYKLCTCKNTLKYVYNFVIKRNTEDVAWKDENCLSTLISDVGEAYKGCG